MGRKLKLTYLENVEKSDIYLPLWPLNGTLCINLVRDGQKTTLDNSLNDYLKHIFHKDRNDKQTSVR